MEAWLTCQQPEVEYFSSGVSAEKNFDEL